MTERATHGGVAVSNGPSPGGAFLRKLCERGPDPNQVVGFLTLVVTSGALLLFSGLAVLGLISVTLLLILSLPIWLPIGAVALATAVGLVSLCGFVLAVVAGTSWLYWYLRGHRPPGSDRFDYARSRIADTASHVKDYARGYGGYLQGMVKDAAPGA